MGTNVNPELYSARDMAHHAAVAADVDLLTTDPRYVANDWNTCQMPREIIVFGAGNFVFQTQRSYAAGGADITLAIANVPAVIPAACIRKIDSTTTCTEILVLW